MGTESVDFVLWLPLEYAKPAVHPMIMTGGARARCQ